MNSYFIFAIVLTVAYIIYYAVIIAHDLYGKKGTDKPDEEVFDLGAPEEEESVAVTESESGFSIGSENYETESTATSSETSPEEDIKDKPGTAQEKLERLKAEAEEQMEETTPYLSDARTHVGGDVQGYDFQGTVRQPTGNKVEPNSRPVVRCRKLKRFYVRCASRSPTRLLPKAAA